MTMEASPAGGVGPLRRLGAAGGALLMLFIGLSFDLSVLGLLALCAIGAAGGAILATKGAGVHPPDPPLQLLPTAPSAETRAELPPPSGGTVLVYLAESGYLIGSFLWRALTVANEWEAYWARLTTIGLDILVIVSLVAVRKRMPQPLFWIALAAGIGLLAIRVTDNGWHTGHLQYELPPR